MVGPYKIQAGIPGLSALLEKLGVVGADGEKNPLTVFDPVIRLTLAIDPVTGTILTTPSQLPANAPASTPGPTPTGRGFIFGWNIGQPAAGSDFSTTIPAARTALGVLRWRILMMAANFTTDANAGNRFCNMVVRWQGDGIAVSQVAEYISTKAIAASNGGTTVLWTPGGADQVEQAGGGFAWVTVPLPQEGIWLTGRAGTGMQILSRTLGIKAGDQWSSINLVVEEFDA